MNAYLLANPIPPSTTSVTGRTALSGKTTYIKDKFADDEYTWHDETGLGVYRSLVGVPLNKDGKTLGVIVIGNAKPNGFSEKQIALLETFADQAIIAITNANLFAEVEARTSEVTEALEYQTATTDVLAVISKSPNKLDPVLDEILAVASRLCQPKYTAILLRNPRDGLFHAARMHEFEDEFVKFMKANPVPMGHPGGIGQTALRRETVYYKDTQGDDYNWQEASRVGKYRSFLGVPLIKDDEVIGVLVLCHDEVAPFSNKQIALLETFAAQAVIAINNAHMFTEIQERTAEVTIALERQTATAEILEVISQSSEDEEPVFKSVVEHAAQLCNAPMAMLMLANDTRTHMQMVANYGDELRHLDMRELWPLDPKYQIAQTILDGCTFQIEDLSQLDLYLDGDETTRRIVEEEGLRTRLTVPLVSGGQGIGSIILCRREVKAFTQDDIGLVETFAEQAVIAIQNGRQFRELQTRLEREKATGEVLKVISQSRDDEMPVFRAILGKAEHLCDAQTSGMQLVDETGKRLALVATSGQDRARSKLERLST